MALQDKISIKRDLTVKKNTLMAEYLCLWPLPDPRVMASGEKSPPTTMDRQIAVWAEGP